MLSFVARTQYQIDRTIARINNPQAAWLFERKLLFHVDVALNQPEVLASLIEEEMSLGDMMTLLKLDRGQFSLVEEKLPPGAPAVGQALQDLALPESAVIAVIIRNHQMVTPRGNTTFQAGDEVLAICRPEVMEALAALFSQPRPGSPAADR